MQKTLKPSKKMFQFPGWMRKNFIHENFSWRVSTETWDASCFKKGLLEKQQEYSKNLWHISTEKYIFSEINRSIFQISLTYIKLVIPKILFILVLCSFNFYFKTTWSPSPSPTKIKISEPPQAKTFLKFLTPLPPKLEGRWGCMPCVKAS